MNFTIQKLFEKRNGMKLERVKLQENLHSEDSYKDFFIHEPLFVEVLIVW